MTFEVSDAMKSCLSSNHFDLVWSMESGEHMPNKEVFMHELFRIAKPGGKVVVVTWCHRELKEGEKELSDKEKKLL